MSESTQRWWTRSGLGLLTAIILLGLVEAALHQDAIVQRYRAVFGAARAVDKIAHIKAQPPKLLLLGNSRIDNDFNPRIIAPILGLDPDREVFNLGIPGANMMGLHGALSKLDRAGLLGPGRIEQLVIGLDEISFQPQDILNLGVFLADRDSLMEEGQYAALFSSWLRLWGYANNIKGLREPGSLQRFIEASRGPLEPWGGAVADNLGYRAGVRNKFQNDDQLRRQRVLAAQAPAPAQQRWLWRIIDLLDAREVQLAVVYPPLLDRQVSFLSGSGRIADSYHAMAAELSARGIPQLTAGALGPRDVRDFANPGHLNARGGSKYSRALARELRTLPDTRAAAQASEAAP